MNTAAIRANRRRLLILTVIVLFCAAAYMLVEVDFSNPRLFAYAMKLRAPKLIVMLITAFSIGGASLVFQSIINNTIVTPLSAGDEFPLYPHPYGSGIFPGIGQCGSLQCEFVLCSGCGAHGHCGHSYLQLDL